MRKKAKEILERYLKGYVTDAQLNKYLELDVLTKKEYEEIYNAKHETQES